MHEGWKKNFSQEIMGDKTQQELGFVKNNLQEAQQCFLKSFIPAQNVQEGTWTISIFKFEHQDTAENALESPRAKSNKIIQTAPTNSKQGAEL